MSIPVRESVKAILLNDLDQILLIKADNATIKRPGEKYMGPFWFLAGGKIEEGESIPEAALREIYEETGIPSEEVDLGPIVWFGEYDLVLQHVLTRMKQSFIVARTKQRKIFLHHPTEFELSLIKDMRWFSLEEIQKSSEIFYPGLLPKYLPDIIAGNYPKEPFEMDLTKK